MRWTSAAAAFACCSQLLADADEDGLDEGDAVGDAVADAVGEAVGEAVGLLDGLADADALGVTVIVVTPF